MLGKRVRGPLLLLAVLGAPGVWGADVRVELDDDRALLVVPEVLRSTIASSFKKFRIPGARDLVGHWGRYDGEDRIPYACWGDFDGNGRQDVALFLIAPKRWTLQAFHQRSDGGYDVYDLVTFPGPDRAWVKLERLREFHLTTLQAGRPLFLAGRPVRGARHRFDSILLQPFSRSDSAYHYTWSYDRSRYSITAIGPYFAD